MAVSRGTSGAASRLERSTPFLSREATLSENDSHSQGPTPTAVSELEQLCRQSVLGYNVICAELGIIPSSHVERVLWSGETEIAMASHGLGAKGTRALAVVLVNNTHIVKLNLSDNNIGNGGAKCLAQMLTANVSIKDLNVSENNIGEEGIKIILQCTVEKRELKSLKLSGNTVTFNAMRSLHFFMENNICLTELYLSNCGIDNDTASLLGQSLGSNDTLLVLDLSWNKIRGRGAVAIAKGLKDNRGLLKVDMSWNGFGFEGCRAMEDCLKRNKTIVELDLTSNRIHAEAAACIIRGLKKNACLEVLKISKNPLTPGASALLMKSIGKLKNSVVRELHIKDIEVNDDFMDELAEIRSTRDLVVYTGALMSRRGKRAVKNEIRKLDANELFRSIVEGEGVKAVDDILQEEFKQRSEDIHKQIMEAKRREEAKKLATSQRPSSLKSNPAHSDRADSVKSANGSVSGSVVSENRPYGEDAESSFHTDRDSRGLNSDDDDS